MTARRILLVDDDVLIALLLEEVLTGLGHEVCAVATTENAAISAALKYKPDLMIVDMRLAEGNGVSAVREILSRGFIPYVLMSGDALSFRVPDPARIILRKPFQEAALVQAMESALARTRRGGPASERGVVTEIPCSASFGDNALHR